MTNTTDQELAELRKHFNRDAREREGIPKRRTPPNPEGKISIRYYCPYDRHTTDWIAEELYMAGPSIAPTPDEQGLYRARLICCKCAMISGDFLLSSPNLADAKIQHASDRVEKPRHHRDGS